MQTQACRASSLNHLKKSCKDILYYVLQFEFLLTCFALLHSSNQKEKEKEDFFSFFLRLTELQRMSALLSLDFLRIAQMASLKCMCLILEHEKEKKKKRHSKAR